MGDPVTQNSTLPTQQPLPENVAQVAASAGLGALVKVYTPKRRNWAAIIFAIIIGLALTIILLGFWLLWTIYRTPNLSRSLAARRLYLFEQGFIVLDRPDSPQVFRFDAVDTVFQHIVSRRTYGVEVGKTYLYTVNARDGRVVKLTQFWDGIAELGPQINSTVSSLLLPDTMAAIQRGQSVQFGDMTLNASGIAGRRKSVTWKEVSDVRIANGYISVKVAGKFWSLSTVAAAKLPNLPLFLTLAGRLKAAGGN
jgi:hypothetical protein